MRLFLIFLLGALILAGCGPAAAPAPTAVPAASTRASTPLSTAAPAPTAVPTNTTAPTIEASPTAAPVESILTLSETPQQMLWLAEGAKAAGITEAGPLLVARIGAVLYPFQPNPLRALPPVTLPVSGDVVAVSPDLRSFIARSAGGSMRVFDLAGSEMFGFDDPAPYYAAYTEDGKTITLNSASEWSITVYDAATGARLQKLTGFETAAPVYSGGLVPGGKTAYWIARATLRLQNAETGEMGKEFRYTDFIGSFAFSPDGSRLAVSVEDKLFLYAVPEGKELAQITRSQPVVSLSFSADGSALAAGYGPGAQVWDGNSLAPAASFPGPNTFTGLVAFSPDGKFLAAAHEGGLISIYPLQSGTGS